MRASAPRPRRSSRAQLCGTSSRTLVGNAVGHMPLGGAVRGRPKKASTPIPTSNVSSDSSRRSSGTSFRAHTTACESSMSVSWKGDACSARSRGAHGLRTSALSSVRFCTTLKHDVCAAATLVARATGSSGAACRVAAHELCASAT